MNPKAREVWRDHSVVVGEAWNEFAEHERRCREPVQQKHYRGIRFAGSPVEDSDTIRFDPVDGCNRHAERGLAARDRALGGSAPRVPCLVAFDKIVLLMKTPPHSMGVICCWEICR